MAAAAPRLNFAHFDERASKGEPLNIVFLGGSLTWGANASDPNRTSYRALMGEYLCQRYPKTPIHCHDAAIGGTGSMLAMFRLERDVLARKPDLVFLDFTVNDNLEGDDAPTAAAYEAIVRELLSREILVIPVFMADRGHGTKAVDAPTPPRYQQHRSLADAYGLPVADVLMHLRQATADGRCDPKAVWPFDGIHPDDAGYRLFFEAAKSAYDNAVERKQSCRLTEKPIFPALYSKRSRIRLAERTLSPGWQRSKTYRTSMWYDGLSSRWMDDVALIDLKDRERAQPLRVEFTGTFVAVFGEADQDGLGFRVTVDGQPVSYRPKKSEPPAETWPFDTARFGTGRLFVWRVLASELPPGKHVLELTPVFPADKTKGQLRIESICVAGGVE